MVANAGINISGGSIDYDVNDWRKVLEVNLVGWFLCAREAARVMLPKGTDQLQIGTEGKIQESCLRGLQVWRHRRDPEPRP